MTNLPQPRLSDGRTVRLAIVAHGTAALTAPELAAVRQRSQGCLSPGLGPRFEKLKPQFLKHSDEQTLAALVAASAAIDQAERIDDFGQWAIVSSTRYLARTAFAAVIDKYQLDGPWGVSVQAIPHGTPHAVASTLSLALGIHGPCIGVGGAVGDEPQAMLSAAGLLQDGRRPGAWLLFSAWSPPVLTESGGPVIAEATCAAAALAVVNPARHGSSDMAVLGQIEFRLAGRDGAPPSSAEENAAAPPGLTEFIVDGRHRHQPWHCRAGANLRISIDWSAACAAEVRDRPADFDAAPPRRRRAA